ncbi:MAG TPA: amidohydrolase [Candidatus Kapabacteria bacterium]|nr:amidohydrolase [Candidatus Kapabacteria bacterium]
MQENKYIDHHAHVWGTGYKMLHPKLDDAKSIDDILNILRPSLAEHTQQFLIARGWDQNKWQDKRFPTREHLDGLTTEIPVALIRIDGHAMWCNSKALEFASVTRNTPIPSGGDILKTPLGEPTGILLDDAMQLIYDAMPPDDEASITRTLRTGLDEFARYHVEVHDMGIPAEWWEPYKKLYENEGDSLIRAKVFLDMSKPSGKKLFHEKIKSKNFNDSPHPNLELVGIKLYLDGALGSRGAQLFEPYSDDPNNYGLSLMDDSEALELMSLATKKNLVIAIHAIGDKANSRALDLFSRIPTPHRRIEHAQIIREEDLPRFAQLGVTAVIQPQFFASDRHWAIDRLGPERMKNAYRWKSLLDAEINVLASSDSPVEEANPFTGIELLQTRDGISDKEAITKEEAEKMYGVARILNVEF